MAEEFEAKGPATVTSGYSSGYIATTGLYVEGIILDNKLSLCVFADRFDDYESSICLTREQVVELHAHLETMLNDEDWS